MRICIIGDGSSIHVKRWVSFFSGRGHEVHVITNRPDRGRGHINHRLWLRLGIYGYGINSRIVRHMVAKIKPDIIHSHYAYGHGYYGAASGFHPFVLTAWGSDVMKDAKSSEYASSIVKMAMEKADAVTCMSEAMREFLAKEYGLKGKLRLIPWGIDTETFHKGYRTEVQQLRKSLGIPAGAPVVLCARGLMPIYGAQDMLEAVPAVLKRHRDAHFVFIRGSKLRQSMANLKAMRKRASELNISANVRFIDNLLPPKELAVYMNMSVISTSFVPYGQLGAVVLESMNCGCVPLASDIPVHREKITHMENGILVNPKDMDALASSVCAVLDDKQMQDSFYAINRKLVDDKENWQKNSVLTERLYQELLESRKGKI